MPELRALWRAVFAQDAPTHNRRFLERRLAYQLQANACAATHGALMADNRRRIEALMAAEAIPPKTPDYRLTPGTVITREYQGVEHEVLVTEDGRFVWAGQPFDSLSAVARAITGSRWSGPLFFGLKARSRGAR